MTKKHVATLKGPRNRVYHFTKEQVDELRSTIDPQLWGLLDTNPMRFAGSDMTGVRAQVTVGGKRYTLDHQDVAELFRQVQVLPFPVGTRLALAEDHEIASGEVVVLPLLYFAFLLWLYRAFVAPRWRTGRTV